MKIKKYLSVAIGILESIEQKPHHQDADGAYEAISQLEEYLSDKGLSFKEDSPCDMPSGLADVTVLNQDNKGIIAKVKFFPMKDSDTLESFSTLDGQINFIQTYTQPDGTLTTHLPIPTGTLGKYFVEISKGSEYEIIKTELHVSVNQEAILKQTLHRIVDMQTLGWHPGDLHHHSIFSSPVHGGTDDVIESHLEVAYSMQAAGLTYGALSDHHNTLNHSEWQQTISPDFLPIISKEISTSNGHVMSLNVPTDVIYDIPSDEHRSEEFLRTEFYRITDEIKSQGGLAQLNHPTDLSPAISLNPKFKDMIEVFDTMEIWNGSNPMSYGTTNHTAALLWISLLEEDRFIPATSGSDTHNTASNDYNTMLDRLTWLIDTVKTAFSSLPLELQEKATSLIDLYDKTTPLLEKWAEHSLGSGCVKTYVYLDEKKSPHAILKGLRKGNSFLTNGPILVPTIEGTRIGETILVNNNHMNIDLKIISNRPLDHLYIYTNGGGCTQIPLITKEPLSSKGFDYSQQIKDFNTEGIKWLFFVAASDFNTLAITNPIFIKS